MEMGLVVVGVEEAEWYFAVEVEEEENLQTELGLVVEVEDFGTGEVEENADTG